MKLKLAPFYSPRDVVLPGSFHSRGQNCSFMAENCGLESGV